MKMEGADLAETFVSATLDDFTSHNTVTFTVTDLKTCEPTLKQLITLSVAYFL
jgi:hypothetical protein